MQKVQKVQKVRTAKKLVNLVAIAAILTGLLDTSLLSATASAAVFSTAAPEMSSPATAESPEPENVLLEPTAPTLAAPIPTAPVSAGSAAAEPGRAEAEVRRTLTAPLIDGKLDESFWSLDESLSVRTGEPAGEKSSFGLLWDSTYLYIAVDAPDSTPIHNGTGYWFDQDNLNLFLDPTLHRSSPFAKEDMQIGILYQPGSSTPEFRFGAALNNHQGKDEKQVLRAIQQTGQGWSAEMAVPWEMLGLDPHLKKQLGLELSVTDRLEKSDATAQRTGYWSAYNSSSFWNDTSGYGVITLSDEQPASGEMNPILLEENFDGYADGAIPEDWIADGSAGSSPFAVVREPSAVTEATYNSGQDITSVMEATYDPDQGQNNNSVTEAVYSNGRLRFDGNAAGRQGRIVAPVQADHYVIEADVRFESVLNSARWAALMFRVPANGKLPYYQMAVRQNGKYELAYRKPDGAWNVTSDGNGAPLPLNKDYSMKVRVFGDNVKEYIKAKDEADYTLLLDKPLENGLLDKGKVGFQADQSAVSFDNLKVTRLTADRLELDLPQQAEALAGPLTVTASVYYSDGLTEPVQANGLKLYSSDESIVRIVNNQPVPVKEGQATVTAVYYQAEASRLLTVTPSKTGAKVLSLSHETGYVLAQTGRELALDALAFHAESSDYSTGELKGDALEWSTDSKGVILGKDGITVETEGIHQLTGRKDDAVIRLILVAKKPEAKEYVLFEDNFDSTPEGTLPDGWKKVQGMTAGKAAVKGGALELNATAAPDNPLRLMLPDYLSLFGNYVIEGDITHTDALNASRWNSVMFRVQQGDYPYYQMAVRKDPSAANGVEFAERTAANQWNVMERGSYTEPLAEGVPLHYTIKAYGNQVQEWINNQLIIETLRANRYAKGGIGLQADSSRMRVDNLRVTLLEEPLPAPVIEPFIKVAEPQTQIALAPTIVTEIKQSSDLGKLAADQLPATAILHLNPELMVIEPGTGAEIAALPEVLAAAGDRVIPAFYVHDALAVDRLVQVLRERGLEDVFVVSEQGELIKRARAAYPMARGILDFTAAGNPGPEELLEMRRATTASGARVALLAGNAATRENTAYLQKLAVMVWSEAKAPAPSGMTAGLHQLITAGVNGLVIDLPSAAHAALALYNRDTTLIRKVHIIGHRGMPSVSPENTIESNVLALDAGADFIENDMFLTTDGHLIITHSPVLETTTDGSGPVENYSLEQLKTYNANKTYPEGFPLVRMPTLDEQLELARSRGKLVYAEIKTQTPEAVDAFVRTVKAHHAEDIVNVMSFHSAQLERLNKLMPEIPAGLLTGYIASENNVEGSLRDTLKTVSKLNLTFNTDYSGLGPEFMEAAVHRGLLISPWTLNKREDVIRFLKLGAFGITTDYAYWASDWAASLSAKTAKIELNPGEERELEAFVETYKGEHKEITPELVFLDGQELLQGDGSRVNARKPGTAHVLLRYSASIENGGTYDLYSQPVEITVKSAAGPTSAPTPTITPTATPTATPTVTPSPAPAATLAPSSGAGGYTFPSAAPGAGYTSVPGTVGAPPSPALPVLEAADGTVEAAVLEKAFRTSAQAAVNFTGDALELPAAVLQNAAHSGALLKVTHTEAKAGYMLPLEQLQLEQQAAALGTGLQEMKLKVTIRRLDGAAAAAVTRAVELAGGRQMSAAVEFNLEVLSDGRSIPVTSGSRYLTRSLVLDSPAGSTATGVMFSPEKGTLSFVPANFTGDGTEGMLRQIQSGSSILSVMTLDTSFSDLNGHWAERQAKQLADKLLLNGTGGGRFEPDRAVTRAEFAAMLARALALPAGQGSGKKAAWPDVQPADWFAGDVNAAAAAGLISGFGDGTLRPDAKVTRSEQAVMLARALRYIGQDSAAGSAAAESPPALELFKDAAGISWARGEWNIVIQAGLMNGVSKELLMPEMSATRAQSAVLLQRFLSLAGFIQ
ncbi:glycerophosphodiester phosphodiesterase family protein [Paenibacillus graminis]|uniref:glycerophosphodiester phosphodiesterase family protein n=3 Tax=Paenibacillus graminis TaxID=189425 RepID=UPI000A60402C|nr:glycerophosphodiester phosphodiesterase family protein [Paenibacillus graminis]